MTNRKSLHLTARAIADDFLQNQLCGAIESALNDSRIPFAGVKLYSSASGNSSTFLGTDGIFYIPYSSFYVFLKSTKRLVNYFRRRDVPEAEIKSHVIRLLRVRTSRLVRIAIREDSTKETPTPHKKPVVRWKTSKKVGRPVRVH